MEFIGIDVHKRESQVCMEVLVRGFSRIGITALVDEATGYEAERKRGELHALLEAYIAKELVPWTKRFPDESFRAVTR